MTILSDFYSSLINSYVEWKSIFINPNYCRNGKEITWNRRASQMMPVNSTIWDVIGLIENQQYSFQMSIDESIIQLYYKFTDEDTISAANLAYYGTIPWGTIRWSDEDDSERNSQERVHDEIVSEVNCEYINWMRIDFDCASEKPSIIHHLAHMHLAGIPSGRIPFDTLPSPFQFIDFVIANYYPYHYRKARMSENGLLLKPRKIKRLSKHRVAVTSDDILPYAIHLSVPKS